MSSGATEPERIYPAAMILDQIGDAVIAIDQDERVTYWGPGAAALYRVPAREALGRGLTEIYRWRWDSPEQERQAYAALEREGLWHGANVHVLRSGEERFVESKVAILRDAAGGRQGLLAVIRDETDRVLAERALAAASRAKDEFLAMMSHELRTPLNAILGWAAILQSRPRDEARVERGIEVILRNARAQERLISDLLDVSRIIGGKLQLNLRSTDVGAVIAAAADVVRPAAEAKGIQLELQLDRDLGETIADPDRLQQIVWNLLSNAVRFTPPGGEVRISAARTGGGIQLQVQDTGEGIPADHLPHIFERFRQVDSSTTRVHGGLGLGLAIVRHLVEAHGGRVEAHSDGARRGATFNVYLPVRAVSAPVASGPAEGRADLAPSYTPSDPATDLRGVRVLVVDDNLDSLELLGALLGGAGADVTTAESASDALRATGQFDVLVSDIAMPEMDGYTLLQRIRARGDENAGVPAIALTAYARSEDTQRVLRAGFQEHLKKPVDPQRLLLTVKSRARPGAVESARSPGLPRS